MYVDYVRECINKIGFLPVTNYKYCETDKYTICPFYKTLNNLGFHCERIDKCAAYKYFGIHDFDKFEEITEQYCLTENNVNCERLKLIKSGQTVPDELLPDGERIKI